MSGARHTAIALLAAVGLAAASASAAGAQQASDTLNLGVVAPPSYVVGPNDVLGMRVIDSPELTTAMRVDLDGSIHIPFGHNIKVGGLRLDAIAPLVAQELVADQIAVDPKVEITLQVVDSKPIIVTGFVKAATTFQALEPIRLLDALNRAGGVSDFTGATVEVTQLAANGTPLARNSYSAAKLLTSNDPADNPLLSGGDEIRVVPGGNVYLSGAVKTPGAYPLSDSDPLTVRKVMTRAGGLGATPDTKRATLIHHLGQPNQVAQPINLGGIINGTAPDITLVADDMIWVPVSGGKRTASDAASRTLSVMTIAAAAVLSAH